MGCKEYKVRLCARKDIASFIETHHYSKNINGCISDYCFSLHDANDTLIGAMFFGRMAMHNQWKKFSNTPDKVIELRRLCCVNETHKNTESYFISKCLKILRKIWCEDGVVVSYADKEYGHSGIIYKASNFKLLHEIKGAKVIVYNSKIYHDKTIRTKYKGQLKPFAAKIKEALETGEAHYKQTAGKYVYVYYL